MPRTRNEAHEAAAARALASTSRPVPPPPLIVTKEHRRFVEFADAVRRERYVGVCYGPPGVGKTLSARSYAGWDQVEPWLHDRWRDDSPPPAAVAGARTAFWTPQVTVTPRQLDAQVPALCQRVSWAVEDALSPGQDTDLLASKAQGCALTELLIVDEADRLKTVGLEQLRDFFDRHALGLVLVGMPGLEKRLARYPQLYSRIGFAHPYRPLGPDELTFVLTHHWQRLGLALSAEDFTDAEAIAAVARITGGNFRLVQRLFTQVQRVLEINGLRTVTREVIGSARRTLVVGA